MEYLEGQTLAQVLVAERRLEVMRALHVGAQIASALAAAHTSGIIHRDLKPDNIMLMARLGDQDFVKVLDFGLAKMFSAENAVKTAAGVLLGTPQYMSPEACESKRDIDHRTDIYALGVLLFQMVTGVLPFDGDSMGEVLVKQVTMLPPAPRAINPAIPPSVEQILLRCLAKPVDARFATMMDLREALLDPESYLHGSPPIAPARSVRSDDGLGDASTLALLVAPSQPTRLAAGSPAQQPTRLATSPAALHKTRLATSNPLPLPAPAPSLTGAHAAATVIAGMSPPRDSASLKRPTVGMPALAQPNELKMNTMRIATPLGYTSRAPRKVWPVVLVMALLFGFGGGALAVWLGGGSAAKPADGSNAAAPADPGSAAGGSGATDGSAAPATASTTPSTGSSTTPNAGAAGSSAPRTAGVGPPSTTASADPIAATAGSSTAGTTAGSAAAPRPPTIPTAHLSIDSAPRGAAVTGPNGEVLGKTPVKLDWPISDSPVRFDLRLVGYRRKTTQTVVNGNTALRVELERAVALRRNPPGPGSGSAKAATGDNALMRPDD
jgi:hypothetical protein